MPVEVWLLFHEKVIIKLAALRDESPGVPIETRLPIVRWYLALDLTTFRRRERVSPNIPIGFWVVRAGSRLKNNVQAAFIRFCQERIKVVESAIFRCDVKIIRDVIAAVPVRRGEVRRKPNGIHTEISQVIEFLGYAYEITDAIAVSVGKGARIDLIEDSGLPPFER
jgi:hypothetical protein